MIGRALPLGVAVLVAALSCQAGELPQARLPEAVLALLADLPANTNRLALETNDYSRRVREWRSQDPWSYEQALGFLRKSTLPDITRCARSRQVRH